MTAIGKLKPSRPKYWGLEWKDFLSLSTAALALVLSLWGIVSQYVESSINEAKQQRQMLYIAMRIGENLAAAYSHRIDSPNPSNNDMTAPLVTAELSAIGIPIKLEELVWDDMKISSDFEFANANFLHAQWQIKDLLDAYYGQDAVKLFLMGYYVKLARFALIRTPPDQRGNDRQCGLWIVHGALALKAIQDTYHLPQIGPEECKNNLSKSFSDKLEKEVNMLEQTLQPRASLFSARWK